MFFLFTDPSTSVRTHCTQYNFCVNLDDAEVSGEAGLCAVIPCSFSGFPFGRPMEGMYPDRRQMVLVDWFKCKSNEECDNPVMIFQSNGQLLNDRVSLLEYKKYLRTCSIIISDLTESDSGSYYPQIKFQQLEFSPPQRTTVSVKGMKDYSKFTQHACILCYCALVPVNVLTGWHHCLHKYEPLNQHRLLSRYCQSICFLQISVA